MDHRVVVQFDCQLSLLKKGSSTLQMTIKDLNRHSICDAPREGVEQLRANCSKMTHGKGSCKNAFTIARSEFDSQCVLFYLEFNK